MEPFDELHIALSCLYINDVMPNSSLITLQVWLGLRKDIHHTQQRLHIPLALEVAKAGADETSPSFLMGACMVMDDIMRYYTVEDQKQILAKLKEKDNGYATSI